MMDASCETEVLKTEGPSKITYREILEHIYEESKQTKIGLSRPSQKAVILDYICKKFNIDKCLIPSKDLTILEKSITTFFSHFIKKYNDGKFSRKIKLILSDEWASGSLTLPPSFDTLANMCLPLQIETQFESFSEEEHPLVLLNPTEKKSVGRKPKTFEEKKQISGACTQLPCKFYFIDS